MYYIIYLKDIGKHWKALKEDSVPVCAISYRNVASYLEKKRARLRPFVLSYSEDKNSQGIRGPPIGRASRCREESERSRQVTRNWLVAREFPASKKRMKEGRRRRCGDADGDFMLNGLDSGMRALDGLPSPRFLPSCSPGSGALTRTIVVVFSEQVRSEDPCRLKLRWR